MEGQKFLWLGAKDGSASGKFHGKEMENSVVMQDTME